MVGGLAKVLSRWAQRWVPDPFVLALLLTLVVLTAGVVAVSQTVSAGVVLARGVGVDKPLIAPLWQLMDGWYDGVRDAALLAFALKMALILVTGHALALSPPVQQAIARVARVPRSAAGATVLVTLVSCAAALVQWGLGAIAGALLARELGRAAARGGVAVHYPLLGAAAYAGFAVWHGGLSGSAPLTVAAEGHFAASLVGVVPMSATVFSAMNLLITGSIVGLATVLFWALTPRDTRELIGPDSTQLAPLPERRREPIVGWVSWLQESPWVGRAVGLAGLGYTAGAFQRGQMVLDLDSVIWLFLFVGIALQGPLRCYVDTIADGARGAGAIILQFPFYFGILGMLKSSGLISAISTAMVEASSPRTLPVLSFLSAGVVNLAVPSGGGQWAVQGELLLGAATAAGVSPATTVLAFSYGDAWTNMLQPFWALPLLGIMGLRARDIVGYTAALFLAMGALVPMWLLVLP